MKLALVLIALFIGLLEAHTLQKRGLCWSNSDCGPNECCSGLGGLRACMSYVGENGLCRIRTRLSCGCEPGLTCVKTESILGVDVKRCKDLTPGSGYF
ncbi:U8-theraphotoxin-Hhn1c 3-like [Hydractinia symbiolongicarpus]|uniref:U8-theraphotoxin-Hhn1c 3-like n=1 Tax=Hydractinia symbiolongicarpus TaxID=13093 RepID=UPI002550D8D3|nr:U8-theraphotoxin-Hhn1c 3-like [Hydractinia symbiolongicarpus]